MDADGLSTVGSITRPLSLMPTTPPATRDQLFARLAALGIGTRTIEHDPVFTVAESDKLTRDLPGADTKNLFLKDDRGALFLVIAKTTTRVDLKALARSLGAGRFSFGKPELLMSTLGVPPGSVTAFALINDGEQRVRVVFDSQLMHCDQVNCHPLENTATTNIARDDLLRFIRWCGHEPRIAALAEAKPDV
jgi:Ala-tRNA(Pro) deacylase